MIRELRITARDPIIARDGRPFGIGQGGRMKPLQWPYPSTTAGAVRTMLGKLEGSDFPLGVVKALKEVEIDGPLPAKGGSLYFPAPRDAARKGQELFAARPIALAKGDGTKGNLMAVSLPQSVEDFKPEKLPEFWATAKTIEWLLAPRGENIRPPSCEESLNAPEVEYRTHTSLDEETGSAKEGMLFQTAALALTSDVEMSVRVNAGAPFDRNLADLPLLNPLGGERRLARWEFTESNRWKCPDGVVIGMGGSRRIRMVLATPAIFEGGWMPDWLRRGFLPDTAIPVTLRGAIVDRWKPISGWSMENGRTGPKPVRRLVPAGSVYFLEIGGDTPFPVADFWLRSVSDKKQDQLDGFGAAIWGTWDEHASVQEME